MPRQIAARRPDRPEDPVGRVPLQLGDRLVPAFDLGCGSYGQALLRSHGRWVPQAGSPCVAASPSLAPVEPTIAYTNALK